MAPAVPQTIENVNQIGTEARPVPIIYVTRLISVENVSYNQPVIPLVPETETFQGVEISPTTNRFTFKEISEFKANLNIDTHYINGNGTNAGLNFPGAGVNGRFSGTLTVNGILTLGNNIKTDGNHISYDGTNAGIDVQPNNDVHFSDNIFVTNIMTSQGNIRTLGGSLVVGTSTGITDTIDFSSYTGIVTITGGAITGKT